MKLYIESVYGDIIIHGKRIEDEELREITKELLNLVGEKEFSSAFIMRYGYEELPFDIHTKVDYVIDLDTHLVYKPKY